MAHPHLLQMSPLRVSEVLQQILLMCVSDAVEADSYLSFLPMDIHVNFEQLFFPGTDDGFYGPIEIPGGFPFGDTVQTGVYVSTFCSQNESPRTFISCRLDQTDYCHWVPHTIPSSTKSCQSPIKCWLPRSGTTLTRDLEVDRFRLRSRTLAISWRK